MGSHEADTETILIIFLYILIKHPDQSKRECKARILRSFLRYVVPTQYAVRTLTGEVIGMSCACATQKEREVIQDGARQSQRSVNKTKPRARDCVPTQRGQKAERGWTL